MPRSLQNDEQAASAFSSLSVSSHPLPSPPSSFLPTKTCRTCGLPLDRPLLCSRCRAPYCSSICQRTESFHDSRLASKRSGKRQDEPLVPSPLFSRTGRYTKRHVGLKISLTHSRRTNSPFPSKSSNASSPTPSSARLLSLQPPTLTTSTTQPTSSSSPTPFEPSASPSCTAPSSSPALLISPASSTRTQASCPSVPTLPPTGPTSKSSPSCKESILPWPKTSTEATSTSSAYPSDTSSRYASSTQLHETLLHLPSFGTRNGLSRRKGWKLSFERTRGCGTRWSWRWRTSTASRSTKEEGSSISGRISGCGASEGLGETRIRSWWGG